MEIAVAPNPVRPPANSRPEPASASESGSGFATAVDATLAGTDGTSAKKGAPPPNGNGTPNLTSPIFAPDILVAGPNEDAILPTETPKNQSALVSPSTAETPKNQSALVPPSPQATGRELDLVRLDRTEDIILRREIAHGVLVGESVPGAFARFRGEALVEWLDFEPVYRRATELYLRRVAEGVR